MKVVLADDEKPLLHFLEKGLKAEGYSCITVDALHEVVPCVKKQQPQILVMDRLFGDQDSISIIDALKMLPSPPMILLLTALDDVSERVNGLKQGADDYLCKPFDFEELIARIEALRRRTTTASEKQKNVLNAGGLAVDQEQRIVYLNQQEVSLTKIEFELVLFLVQNLEKVLSRERILNRVWGAYSDPQTNIVDVYISRLRRKLESDSNIQIQTLRGNGYRLAIA